MELAWVLLAGLAALAVVALLPTRASRRDPVCGMKVAADTPYQSEHAGRRYRFCTRSCLNKFQADPVHWLSHPSQEP